MTWRKMTAVTLLGLSAKYYYGVVLVLRSTATLSRKTVNKVSGLTMLPVLFLVQLLHHAFAFTATRIRARHFPLWSVQTSVSIGAVGEELGSGSYGIVRWIQDDEGKWWVGKRSKTQSDLDDNDEKDQSKRCVGYWKTEKHCYETIGEADNIVSYQGTAPDAEGNQWMLFKPIYALNNINEVKQTSGSRPPVAPTLQDLLEVDRLDHLVNDEHHLYKISEALGIDEPSITFTLDVVVESVLQALVSCHEHKVVHRDVKPGNLLVGQGSLHLMDLGSAADLEPRGLLRKRQGFSEGLVQVSPIYAAPELFINPSIASEALRFDVFSAALMICQILFQYTDERTESGFRQQLAAVDNDLDAWLLAALQGKVKPVGMMSAMDTLRDRPGMWSMLRGMLKTRPQDRLSSFECLKLWRSIVRNGLSDDAERDGDFNDGVYLREVVDSSEVCSLPPTVWPLHYVAAFDMKKPLGLYLAESSHSDEAPYEMNEDQIAKWVEGTEDAAPGEVFVQGVVPGGQAEDMGIFEIGDRVQSVGEVPVNDGGFERVVSLIQNQPARAQYINMHFDRRSTIDFSPTELTEPGRPLQIVDQGTWSYVGRRKTQEDAFIIHELHDVKQRSILLTGIMDGHMGKAASSFVREHLPTFLSEELLLATDDIPTEELLGWAWDRTCLMYQNACFDGDQCVADYDPREGLLMANSGSVDWIAGTTANIAAFDKQTGRVVFLNCGDSRGIVVDEEGKAQFVTKDHTPEREKDRFEVEKANGTPYGEVLCSMSSYSIKIGDCEYAVARSLEGPYATELGIISTPDIEDISIPSGSTVLQASDGLWEVMDTQQVAKLAADFRNKGMSAPDVAKNLCGLAHEKGSSDNISVTVVYVV